MNPDSSLCAICGQPWSGTYGEAGMCGFCLPDHRAELPAIRAARARPTDNRTGRWAYLLIVRCSSPAEGSGRLLVELRPDPDPDVPPHLPDGWGPPRDGGDQSSVAVRLQTWIATWDVEAQVQGKRTAELYRRAPPDRRSRVDHNIRLEAGPGSRRRQ